MQPVKAVVVVDHLREFERGQIGVVILLLMVILLTVGLAFMFRSSREVRLATQGSEAQPVFQAAETGLEHALATDLRNLQYNNQDEYQVEAVPLPSAGRDFLMSYRVKRNRSLDIQLLKEGMSAELDLTGASSLQIDWAQEDCPNRASMYLAVYYRDGGGNLHTRQSLHAGCRRADYGFPDDGVDYTSTAADLVNDQQNLKRRLNVDFTTLPAGSTPVLARVKPVYAPTRLRVRGNNLPPQSFTITATGTSSRGDERRSVQLDRTLPVAPSILDFVVFSGSQIVK